MLVVPNLVLYHTVSLDSVKIDNNFPKMPKLTGMLPSRANLRAL